MQTIKTENGSNPQPPRSRQRPSNWYLLGESVGALKLPPRCLKLGENKVGTASTMDIRLPSRKTSAFHCVLAATADEVILRDRSRNGTWVNHCKYHKSRQILSDGDLIAFGQVTLKYDKDDHGILVFRLKYNEPTEETISLSDDDGDYEPRPNQIPIKSEVKTENGTEDAHGIDSFETHANDANGQVALDEYDTGAEIDEAEIDDAEGEDDFAEVPDISQDWHRAEMFMDRMDFWQPNEEVLVSTEWQTIRQPTISPSTAPPPSTVPPPLVSPPPLNFVSDIPIAATIKEEVVWNTYEYEKTLHPAAEESEVVDTIDLCASDDDENGYSVVPNQQPIASTSQRNERKHKQTEDEYEMKWAEMDAKRVKCVSDEKPTPMKRTINELPESEKNRLIDAVQLDKNCLKVKAHVVTHSRGGRLALDMLGIGDNMPSTSKEKSKSSSHTHVVRNLKVESLQPTLEEDSELYRCIWSGSVNANRYITEITGWDVQWFLVQKSDAPVCDERFKPFVLPHDFDSVKTYQYAWSNLAKLAFWDSLLSFHRQERTSRAVFMYLTDVKYVKRHDDSARFIYFCEKEIEEDDTRSVLYNDHLVLVVHGGGKFLALITAMRYTKGDNKVQMTFQMEAAKSYAAEKLANRKRILISVKSIKNIRVELEQYSALMDVDKSPSLCETIMYPAAYRFPFMDQVFPGEEWTQSKIVDALHEKCVESVFAQKEAVYLIEGGAGTGKSIILLNALKKIFTNGAFRSKRILFCGATNVSVDQITQCFNTGKHNKFVRFGPLKAIHPGLAKVSIPPYTCSQKDRQTIIAARLVLTTADMASQLLKVSPQKFDLCIMDEASAVHELMVLPLLKFKFKVLVMAGDKQFQYTPANSSFGSEFNYYRSFFNRVIDSYHNARFSCYPTLYTQYRMHPEISCWPNKQFYGQQMKPTNVSLKLDDNFRLQPYTVFSFETDVNEVDVVEELLSICFPYADSAKYSYGIIPACWQTKNQLQERMKDFPEIEISNNDCFEGTEKDVILITAIKSKNFELLSSPEMINVAVTRARRTLIFCGNFDEVKHFPVWKSFLDDANDRGRLFTIDFRNADYVNKLLK